MTTTCFPVYLISRIDGAIKTGILPTNETCSRTRALAVVGCTPKSGRFTAQDVADWINSNRIAKPPKSIMLQRARAQPGLWG